MTIALSSPLLVGVYKDGLLIESYERDGHTSDELPVVFADILNKYDVKNLFYARGPGSFMAIKIAYIFLKTLSSTLEVGLFACNGFSFNGNLPIRALKKVYFVEEDGKITTKIFNDEIEQKFKLPKILEKEIFSDSNEPLYVLPAV